MKNIKYNKINQEDLDYLKTIVSEEDLIWGTNISEDFTKDELGTVTGKPEVMLYVKNTQEISKIMKYANEHYIPVVVRGSGTGLVGACVPLYGGIIINTSKMNKILELDEANLTLTVEPGVLLMEIYDYVEPKGYFYAPDPGEKSATIGGNIATNAGGMRAVKYGVTRDWVRAIEVVLPNGDIEWFENEFLIIESESGSALGRYTNGKIVPLTYSKKLPVGCKSLNVEQTMLWECLLAPPEIAPLVVVKGAAGTGKTYCSIAMTLEKLRGYSLEELYDQILVATPTVTVSNESIGYLPGTIDDKIGPYLGGIIDNIKAIFREKNMDLTNRDLKASAQELFERGFIEIQPIGFLRGRTIPRTVFIIDETQNISPSDIHDIVTRAAQGSKFIFLGDPDQVNNPKLNTRYNALVYLSEKMKGSVNCWQITLNSDKSIRSALAQEALKIL